MVRSKALASSLALILTWAPTAFADEEPWAHFIGSYICQVGKEVDLSLKEHNPRLRVFAAGQESLEFSIVVPIIKRDRDSCINGAEEFAKAVRSGSGPLILGAKSAMDSWCNDRLELVISKFSIEPSRGKTRYYFTYEFVDDLDL